jgi:hypothetical protein
MATEDANNTNGFEAKHRIERHEYLYDPEENVDKKWTISLDISGRINRKLGDTKGSKYEDRRKIDRIHTILMLACTILNIQPAQQTREGNSQMTHILISTNHI